jgi:hypothetical protein
VLFFARFFFYCSDRATHQSGHGLETSPDVLTHFRLTVLPGSLMIFDLIILGGSQVFIAFQAAQTIETLIGV